MGAGERGANSRLFEKGREKFLEEAQRLAKFQALPGIVTVYNYFQENKTAYIVMEYVEGQTLLELMEERGGKIEVKELLDFGAAREYVKNETKSMTLILKRGFAPLEQLL